MNVKEILDIANSGYPDGFLSEHYTSKGTLKRYDIGDGLARFIVSEIIQTYDDGSSDKEQLEHALHVMRNGERDINYVCNAIEGKLFEMED